MTFALPLLIALAQVPDASPTSEEPRAVTSDDLEPASRAAKSLKCGMTRDEIKAAFKDVRRYDKRHTEGPLEALVWRSEARACRVIVTIDTLPGEPPRLARVTVRCDTDSPPDHWGESKSETRTLHELSCPAILTPPKAKKPAPR